MRNKVCVITGGANGIGRAIIEQFLKQGVSVCFIDIDKDAGTKLVEKYPNLLFFHGDVGKKHDLEAFALQVIAKHQKIDFLINNACTNNKGILSNCSYEDFNEIIFIGVSAPYYLTKLFLDNFNEQGVVINISSTRAFMSQPDTESYTAAKGGIKALTHALAISLQGRVRVNCISPGWIDTNNQEHEINDKLQHPSQRIGVPNDIARTVLFLCSKDAGFINGEDIVVDGGMTKLMIYNNDHGWSYNK